MSRRSPPFAQRSLESLSRRLRRAALRWVSKRFVHRHRVSRLRIGGRTFKRIDFGDAFTAERVARALEHFSGAPEIPELWAHFDAELLVEFVPGDPLARLGVEDADALARFYARIHRGGSRLVAIGESGQIARAERDLAFLQEVGVVDRSAASDLGAALAALAPDAVHIGWDYTDAVAKNFVRRADGSLAGIDVEALREDALVGTGVAKCLVNADGPHRERLLAALASRSDLDLAPTLPFVELCFSLAWLRNRCLKGSSLEPRILERFRGTGRPELD